MTKHESNAELADAMLVVRQSYRMLFDFHKRVQSTIDILIENINEYEFAYWVPEVSKANSTTNPHYPNRWTWDAFPQHTYSVFATKTGSMKEFIKPGDTLVEIRFSSDDSIFELYENHEPNPDRVPVSEAITSIKIIFWHCKSILNDAQLHWYNGIWRETDYSFKYGEAALTDVEGTEIYQIPYNYPLETLKNKSSVVQAAKDSVAEFKNLQKSL